MEVLNQAQLNRLESHKYRSSGTSLVEPIFQVFWRRLVELFPLWVAPNAITVAGLVINIITSLILIWYCPTATEVAPGWLYFINAIGLFIYQSLDAIDGKQARRTGSSTPLGELFDHGCDSISTVFVTLAVCISLQLGNHPWAMAILCMNAYSLFYIGHWCSYVTGTLQFGLIDVTEVQLFTMVVFAITGTYSPIVWSQLLPFIGIPLRSAIVVFWMICILCSVIRFGFLILGGGCGENGATIADTSILSPGLNIGIVVAFALSIASQSKNFLCLNHPVLYLLLVGIVCSKVTNRLVVAHMTRSELQLLDTSLLGLIFLFLNQYFGFLVNEYFLLWICFIFSGFDLLQYLTQTYRQIASHLKIYIFSLESREDKSKAK